MAEYRRGAHTVFEIPLHLVWITKYRRPALQGEVATRVRDLIREHEVAIMKGACVEGPPSAPGLSCAISARYLEVSDTFLLFRVHRNDGLSLFQEPLRRPIDTAKLPVAVRVGFALFVFLVSVRPSPVPAIG
jgi:hypothetical protein